MSEQHFGKAYGEKPPLNYERFFVPVIGAPLAKDLIKLAELRPGEQVLDVACGTGIVARLASQQVGATGTVAGLDVNPGMLAVARSATPSDMAIKWYESSAEEIPTTDAAFDVGLCQMGLQFMHDKNAALREIRRVLVRGGRLIINMPGPTPQLFTILGESLEHHISSDASGFVYQVFSLHDTTEIQDLLNGNGFHDVSVQSETKSLRLPKPEDFLWQYVHSTPLSGVVAHADDDRRVLLEQDVVAKWRELVKDGALTLQVRVVTASARK